MHLFVVASGASGHGRFGTREPAIAAASAGARIVGYNLLADGLAEFAATDRLDFGLGNLALAMGFSGDFVRAFCRSGLARLSCFTDRLFPNCLLPTYLFPTCLLPTCLLLRRRSPFRFRLGLVYSGPKPQLSPHFPSGWEARATGAMSIYSCDRDSRFGLNQPDTIKVSSAAGARKASCSAGCG